MYDFLPDKLCEFVLQVEFILLADDVNLVIENLFIHQ